VPSDRRLGHAAPDVPEGGPALDPRFPDLSNALLRPRPAGGTIGTRQAMGQLSRDDPMAHFAGEARPTPVP